LVQMVGSFHQSMADLAQLPYPVVCAIQGGAAGGGLGFVWAADIVIAADDLKLVTAFARLGVSGDGGGTWYLPQLVGLRHALQLTLESPTVNAAEAVRFGLVTRIVARDALQDEAESTVARLGTGPTQSLALQRKLIRAASARTMENGLLAEVDAMRISGHTTDACEGMAAFMEHRAANFSRR
ncbi:MAG: enoyl-CoA hydratase/isomerase family protein, partial [Actinobacteria bacterium]|nr:enoyl-CoA hydratase/isomerase family protein [Actinomycetota bacterium]